MKPPTRRLGSGPDQDKEIMQHPFFEPVDFEKLAAKKLDPPFRPDVKNILDPKFVPKTYLQVRNQHSGARKITLGFASRATFLRVRILLFYQSANKKMKKNTTTTTTFCYSTAHHECNCSSLPPLFLLTVLDFGQEPAKDSFDRNAKGATNVAFNDFTYQPDSVLDGGN